MKFSKYNIITNNSDNDILFNTLWGNTFLISANVKAAINERNPDLLTEEEKKSLESKKMLIPDTFDEARIFNYYFNKSKFGQKCVTATVLLTWACNFQCTYCYEGAGTIHSETLTAAKAMNIADFLIRCSQEQGGALIHVVLFGEEPLLNPSVGFQLLCRLKKYCDKENKVLQCSIVTNGSLLTQEIIDELILYNCIQVQITLDGPPEIHDTRRVLKDKTGTFQQVLKGIKLVDQYYPKLFCCVRINVDKTNLEEIPRVFEYLKNAGIKNVHIDYGIVRSSTTSCATYADYCLDEKELGGVLDGLWKLAESNGFNRYPKPYRKWTYCGLYNDYNFTFSPIGDVYKCWEMVGDEQHRIGTIDDKGNLVNMTYSFYDWATIDPLQEEDCSNCAYLPVCGGGCKMVAYSQSHTYHAKGCAKIKGVIEKQWIHCFEKTLNDCQSHSDS